MSTEHYGWDEINGTSEIDIATDVNSILQEIDDDLYATDVMIQTTEGIASEAAQAISDMRSGAEVDTFAGMEDKIESYFPVQTDNIDDGAVSYDKLESAAITSIFNGITVRRFDSRDNTADNTGMSVPDVTGQHLQSRLAGYYIPELYLLVITKIVKPDTCPLGAYGSGNGWTLPSYVPTFSKKCDACEVGMTTYAVDDFYTVGISTNGKIGTTGDYTSAELVSVGNIVVNVKPFIA